MDTTDDKPKSNERLRRCIDFVFGFENKKGDILDYWMYSADGFSFSPKEFYANVEARLAARRIPSMEITRQEFGEAGILSDQRLYLRLMRERLAITTCAAPFGDIFFFSCRTVYVPALVRLWHILAVTLLFTAIFALLVKPLGIYFGTTAVVALMFALAAVFRNASAAGLSDLDALLLRIPVVSTFYENWFREETYYRLDTRNLYLKLLPKLIQELAEETCAEKGVKLVPQFQRAPALSLLSNVVPRDKKPPEN